MNGDDLSSQVDSKKARRKPYVKPRMEQVPLLPEEAVLVSGCKTTSGGGYLEGDCINDNCLNDYGS